MIVVIGHLKVAAEDREAHLALSQSAVRAARTAPGCHHFAVAADLLEPTWVAVAELWSSRDDLEAFRNIYSDDDDTFKYIQEFAVQEYEIA